MDVIRVSGLEKYYGSRQALKGLTFSVGKGEIFALLGTNGAGKTTCLECMEGLRDYEKGRIEISGKKGIQLQSSSLPEHIRACEALRLFSSWNQVPTDNRLADALGLREFAKKQYYELSTGQKRRLHLALALLQDPELVFLDEPTAGLDVEGRSALHNLIRVLKKAGKTVVLASHDMAEVEELCDRLAILKEGSIAFLGTVEELSRKVKEPYHICVRTKRGTERFSTYHVEETLFALLDRCREEGTEILDLSVGRGSLKEHFMKFIKEDDHVQKQ